jgi:hypothetical protein
MEVGQGPNWGCNAKGKNKERNTERKNRKRGREIDVNIPVLNGNPSQMEKCLADFALF